jgi:dUTP pyrophosphatase
MKILKIRDVKTPNRGTSQSAGLDLFVPNNFTPLTLKPGQSVLIPSGIKFNVPEGHALVAFNKSGIAAKKNLLVGACVIDEDYCGEVHIDLKNVGEKEVEINPGEKIIQLLCLKVNYVSIEEVSSEEELYRGKTSERGEGGFGSTGLR